MAPLKQVVVILAAILIAVASFELGRRMQSKSYENEMYYTQAMLAFAHHKSYDRIRVFLEKKCYDAALTDAMEMQKLQVVQLSENLKGTGNDPELLEYINFRNPELLQAIQAGHIPELHPYTTTCPAQPAAKGPSASDKGPG